MAVAEMLDRRRFNELLFAAYEGISQDRLLLLADEAFDTVVQPRHLPGRPRSRVTRCRDEGHDVVLVSGALDFLMERLAKHLGATAHVVQPPRDQGRLRHRQAPSPHRRGPGEGAPLREWATAHGHDLGDCFAYSDSYSDVPMLSVVGHPCVVNPDLRLRKLARTYAWPLLTLDRRGSSAVPALAAQWLERLP